MEQIDKTQQRYARIAGFTFLFLIVTFMFGEFTISGIAGSGTFRELADRIIDAELRYRIALASQVITSVSTVLLAFSLYMTLKPVNQHLAQISMYWRLGEAVLSGVIVSSSFARLSLYSSVKYLDTFEVPEVQAMVDLTRSFYAAGFNVSTLFFSIGSAIFFYLFLTSRSIPRAMSVFGIFASILVVLTGLGNLIIPQHGDVIQYGWIPMFIIEIVTGVWLLVFGVRSSARAG